jgi:NAD(P)-dependent dehydrogenase (short-subunit alcohol dehydrogenase family)
MQRLKDEVAVVTGGGADIGRATRERVAEEGAAVVIAERDTRTGREVAEQIKSKGGNALFVETNVADDASIQRMKGQDDKRLFHGTPPGREQELNRHLTTR